MADGLHVLYIDDDAGTRRLVERALRRRGYRVTLAERGEDGVALAAVQTFDVVAVDHFMPGIDGLETLARLRALPEPPAVIYVTGSEEGRIAVAALRAGAADYVIKSIGEDFFDLLAASFEAVAARAALERGKARVEEELRASNARLEALLSEVNHRVANSLQLVTAILRLQHGALADSTARAALDDTQRRINAIAQVHRRLYTDNAVESVDMQEYLAALVNELRATWSTTALPRELNLVADPIRLATDRAVSLGVIVTELVSNACKYAYPGQGGEVRVALATADDGHFRLAVEDDGIGIAPGSAPQGTGVGTKLIRAMAQSLRSTIEYDMVPRGTRVTLTAAIA